MSRLAKFCKAALCVLGSIDLIASAQETNTQAEPGTAVKSPALFFGGINPEFKGYGYALREVIPIDQLPPRIVYNRSEISLIVDQDDRQTRAVQIGIKPYIAVYLVNDTDQAISGIVGELWKVRSQVKFGGNWFSREPVNPGCGSVPPPKDLPARHALALGAVSDRFGDTGGEIRYVFSISSRVIASEPIRGCYFSNDLLEVMTNEQMEQVLGDNTLKNLRENHWNQYSSIRNLEEFCVALELTRHYQLSLKFRSQLQEWIIERAVKQDATPEQTKAIARIKEILASPWLIDNDAQTLADRCIAAIESKPSSLYGAPENCTVFVWEFISSHSLDGGFRLAGHETKAVSEESRTKLIRLAIRTLDSPDPVLGDAAAIYLGNRKIEEDLFPAKRFQDFLLSGRPRRVSAGLGGLKLKNKVQEIGNWMVERVDANDPKIADYYQLIYSYAGDVFGDWERRVLLYLLEKDPLGTLKILSVSGRIRSGTRIPDEFVVLIRNFARDQLSSARREWWRELGERDQQGEIKQEEKLDCQALSEGIRMIDRYGDPADTLILEQFLDHPAATFSSDYDGSGILFFTARETAKQCLQRRRVQIPESIVTQIKIDSPISDRDHNENIMRYGLPIVGIALFALVVAGLIVVKLRRKAGTAESA